VRYHAEQPGDGAAGGALGAAISYPVALSRDTRTLTCSDGKKFRA
jgi:hypothetical protein